MSQNESSPLWVRVVAVALLLAAVLVVWQYLASLAMMWLLFKGKPPIPVMPWTLLQYVVAYSGNKAVMKPAGLGAGLTAIVAFGFPAFLIFTPKRHKIHGTARFATKSEIRKAGLMSDTGTIVGKVGNRFLRLAKGHIQVSAATGTGKGVGYVTPNLLANDCSMVVTDPKLYSWSVTASYRQKCGHKVFLFNPADPKRRTHRWNPLGYIRPEDEYRIDDTQRIASILFPDIKGTDPIWTAGSRSLFCGLVYFMMETPDRQLTLGQLAREAYVLDAKAMEKAMADRAAAGNPYSDACVMAMRDYLSAPDKTRESIRKTFTSRLDLFQSPNIDAATSANDFDLRQLRREKITIYLCSAQSEAGRIEPLLNLFFQQAIMLNIDVLPKDDPTLKHQLRFLMDEFYGLGKMPVVLNAIAISREYNVFLEPVYQSESQLVELYGKEGAAAFLDNLTARIVYEPPRRESAEALAKELGQMTVKSESKSKPTNFGKGNHSVSESQAAKALVPVDELLAMGTTTEFIFVRGNRPIKCKKVFFYQERTFVDRLKEVSPSLAALGRRLPTEDQLNAASVAGELAPVVEPVPLVKYKSLSPVADDRPTRPIEVGDLAKLKSIGLSDFALDFSGIKVPAGEIDDDEMAEFADSVYRKLVDN